MFEKRRQALALQTIKQYISDDFKRIKIKNITNIPELSDIILYSETFEIKAKLVDGKTIHLKLETVYGIVYEGFYENYIWFLDTFYIN